MEKINRSCSGRTNWLMSSLAVLGLVGVTLNTVWRVRSTRPSSVVPETPLFSSSSPAASRAVATAVDAAPEMLARARTRLGPSASVRFVEADLFSWHPARRYDAVFFGFSISHVPEDRFEPFWDLVDEALEPTGTVFFFDDNHRTDIELAEGVHSPIVRRELNDGTQFRVIKIPYEPAQLERRLRELGWDIKVTGTSGPFYWGTGGR